MSENYFFKLGQSVNFINKRQYDDHSWHLNGVYALGQGFQGLDGVFTFLFDAEIVGFSYFNGKTGINSSTIIDVHKLTDGGTDAGSIWDVKPEVDTTAADSSYYVYDQLNGQEPFSPPTGFTQAVLNSNFVNYNAGDALRLDIDQAMGGANNFQLTMFYRPR